MSGGVWLCPQCQQQAILVMAKIVYPRDRSIEQRLAIVCWPPSDKRPKGCGRFRMKGGEWTAIDMKRHERQWLAERRDNEREG